MDAPRLRIIRYFLGLGSAVLAASIIVHASLLPERPMLGMSERGDRVGLVKPHGPASRAGLAAGDRIVSVNGRQISGMVGPSFSLRSGKPGETIQIAYQRDGTIRQANLVPDPLPRSEMAWQIAQAAAALIALFVGSVAAMRRTSLLTIVFFLICLAFSVLLFFPYVPSHPSFWIGADAFKALISSFLPALFVHFFLLFPYERPIVRRRRWLVPALYGVSSLLFVGSIAISLGLGPRSIQKSMRSAHELLSNGAFFVAFTGSVWLFFRAFRRTTAPSIRRKLRVALWGTIAGVLPVATVLASYAVFPERKVPADRLAAVALVLVPIGFAYAIVKHGVFDIERIVKRSLAITGVTAMLILLYFLAYFLLRALLHSVTSLSGTLLSVVAFLFVILLFSPIRTRIEDFVDRSIYPERFEARRRLSEFTRNLPRLSDETAIARASLETVAQAFGVERGAFFSEGPPRGADFSWGISAPAAEAIRIGTETREILYRRKEPMLREEIDAEISEGKLPLPEEQAMSLIGAAILIPIATERRRFGLAVLGRRVDGDSYSASDLEILESLGTQTALAMENARFQQELRSKEALTRELEVARAVQGQLLPRKAPAIPGLEIAAVTFPCRDVGGDYFDYVQTGEGRLTFAVGDVTGKGIPAALLMANVQALFRAEASDEVEPDQILDRMNRRLCALDRPERFVSFFCAIFHPGKGEIIYSSAGHPPPVLVRFDGSIHRLDAAGLLLGIDPEATYPVGIVRLRPGDLLLCYTDGIADPSAPGPGLREDQVEEIARSLRHLPATEILGRIEAGIQRHPVLEDDTTVLVLKRV